jgi:hypothetical protein
VQGEPVLPCRSVAPGRQVLDYLWRGTLAPDGCRQHGKHESSSRVLAQHKPWGALLWPPWRSTRLLVRHPAAWDTMSLPEARAVPRNSFERLKVMSLSGSNDRPKPDGGNPALSGAAGPRSAAARQRLAKALRANLVRRKAQKRERRKQAGDAAESKTARDEGAQNGASTKQD